MGPWMPPDSAAHGRCRPHPAVRAAGPTRLSHPRRHGRRMDVPEPQHLRPSGCDRGQRSGDGFAEKEAAARSRLGPRRRLHGRMWRARCLRCATVSLRSKCVNPRLTVVGFSRRVRPRGEVRQSRLTHHGRHVQLPRRRPGLPPFARTGDRRCPAGRSSPTFPIYSKLGFVRYVQSFRMGRNRLGWIALSLSLLPMLTDFFSIR